MINQSSAFTQPHTPRLPWVKEQLPAIQAAATWWLVFLALAVLNMVFGWGSRLFIIILQLLVSMGAGLQAAWLTRRNSQAGQSALRQGALAGFILPLTTGGVILLIAILVGITSLGVLIPLIIVFFLFLPFEIAACAIAGLAGAGLYGKFFAR